MAEQVAVDRASVVSDFAASLRPGQRILEHPDWYVWCCAPVYDGCGMLHVYFSRWPKKTGMGGWRDHSEIAHAVAPSLEGPWTVCDDVFKGDTDEWDASVFNPNIHRVGDQLVLLYTGRKPGQNPFYMQIGMAVRNAEDASAGSWEKMGPVVFPSGRDGDWNALHTSNPALLAAPDGTFRIYYKGIDMETAPRLRTVGVAVAESLFGPYRDDSRNPLIDYRRQSGDIEDPYAFYRNGRFYLIAEDRTGVALGGNFGGGVGGTRPGLIYSSDDGYAWGLPEVGYQTNDTYFDEPRERFERPHILWKEGEPEALFLALKGGRFGTSSCAFLNIRR